MSFKDEMSERAQWLSGLKVGDSVVLVKTHGSSLEKIARETKDRLYIQYGISAEYKISKKDGYALGTSGTWHGTFKIVPLTQKFLDDQEHKKLVEFFRNLFVQANVPLEKLRQMKVTYEAAP